MLDINYHKAKLEAEKAKLEEEIRHATMEGEQAHGIGEKEDEREPDPGDMANRMEDYGEEISITHALKSRLLDVKAALLRINDGGYGFCEAVGDNHPIEIERLEADPAARTCVKHI